MHTIQARLHSFLGCCPVPAWWAVGVESTGLATNGEDQYSQSLIIRNSVIRNNGEILGKFKKWLVGRLNIRNNKKNLRNT